MLIVWESTLLIISSYMALCLRWHAYFLSVACGETSQAQGKETLKAFKKDKEKGRVCRTAAEKGWMGSITEFCQFFYSECSMVV